MISGFFPLPFHTPVEQLRVTRQGVWAKRASQVALGNTWLITGVLMSTWGHGEGGTRQECGRDTCERDRDTLHMQLGQLSVKRVPCEWDSDTP